MARSCVGAADLALGHIHAAGPGPARRGSDGSEDLPAVVA
jgi:hypothetical protein